MNSIQLRKGQIVKTRKEYYSYWERLTGVAHEYKVVACDGSGLVLAKGLRSGGVFELDMTMIEPARALRSRQNVISEVAFMM